MYDIEPIKSARVLNLIDATLDLELESNLQPDLCRKLRLAAEYIDQNLRNRLTLAEIAAEVGLNPHYFARVFKKATGHSPHQYILEKRIELAKDLLKTTELPLVEIALQVGIATQSHFTTVFHRLTDMTPREFREK
jgi:AraC family transcriptional regulator